MKTKLQIRNFTLWLSAGLVFLYLVPCSAAYNALIPLANRNPSKLNQRFAQGANQLITRLTGSSEAARSLAITPKQARRWVDSYHTQPQAEDAALPFALQINFSRRAISKELRTHALSVWKQPRPELVMLLKSDTIDPLSADDAHWQALETASQKRGVIMRLPQRNSPIYDQPLDLNNWPALTTQYDTDHVIVAELPATDSTDQPIQWTWYHQGQLTRWGTPNTADWADLGVEKITKTLAQSPAAAPLTRTLQLKIDGINNFATYAHTLKMLQKLPHIQSLSDNGIQNNQLLITIKTHQPLAKLRQELEQKHLAFHEIIPKLTNIPFPISTENKIPTAANIPQPSTTISEGSQTFAMNTGQDFNELTEPTSNSSNQDITGY